MLFRSSEVRLPVVAATLSSVIVFVPLVFTSDLTYAILGDLAKAVVFSHGFCVFVALFLVPTIRLQILNRRGTLVSKRAPLDGFLEKVVRAYGNFLTYIISKKKIQNVAGLILVGILVALLAGVLPKLPRELIGKPDTDWILLGVETRGNSLVEQMESQTEEVEEIGRAHV